MNLIIIINSSSSRKRIKSLSQIASKYPRGLFVLCAKLETDAYLYYRYTNAMTDKYLRFCREILESDVDQIKRLRIIRLRDIQVYMR